MHRDLKMHKLKKKKEKTFSRALFSRRRTRARLDFVMMMNLPTSKPNDCIRSHHRPPFLRNSSSAFDTGGRGWDGDTKKRTLLQSGFAHLLAKKPAQPIITTFVSRKRFLFRYRGYPPRVPFGFLCVSIMAARNIP